MSQISLQQMLPIGAILGGRYRVVRHIASGGFGNTYEVEHVQLLQHFAMKEFFMNGVNHRSTDGFSVEVSNPTNAHDFGLQMQKFQREAQRLSLLHHPNIVRVTDLFDANGTSYFVMELIQGEALSERLKRGVLNEMEARNVLAQLLDALETVHGAGLTHLDIKPENIMIDSYGHITLLDFGASKQLSKSQRTSLPLSGLAYTPGYAPYEQVTQMTDKLGPWTDFYALGATLYHLLSGQCPPEADISTYDEQTLMLPQQVSMPMQLLIKRMMNPDRLKRPQTVNEVRALLMGDERTVVKPSANALHIPQIPQTPQKPRNPRSSKRLPLLLSAIFLALILAGVLILVNPWGKKTVEETPVTPVDTTKTQKKKEKEEKKEEYVYSEFPFDNCQSFHDGLAPAKKNNKWGVIDKKWQWVVKPTYDSMNDFSEGMALVKLKGKVGYIDKQGKEEVNIIFDDGLSFHDGLARVKLNEKYGYVDKQGRLAVASNYDLAWSFSEGLAPVKIDGKWGYINKMGEVVIPCKFSAAEEFNEGYARVKDEDGYSLINKKGEVVIHEAGASMGIKFSEGRLMMGINGKCGFIDIDGHLIVNHIYDNCYSYSEGMAAVKLNGKYGFIDKEGKMVIPAKYDDVNSFSESRARVKLNGKYGIIDKDGNEIVPCEYDLISSYHDGLAYVKRNGKYGYIDKQGKLQKIKQKK